MVIFINYILRKFVIIKAVIHHGLISDVMQKVFYLSHSLMGAIAFLVLMHDFTFKIFLNLDRDHRINFCSVELCGIEGLGLF